jgi:hypothetical protein
MLSLHVFICRSDVYHDLYMAAVRGTRSRMGFAGTPTRSTSTFHYPSLLSGTHNNIDPRLNSYSSPPPPPSPPPSFTVLKCVQ